MSGLHELLAEHCPDGVPYRTLGELGTFVRGNGLQKKDFVEAGVGCIHYGQIYTFYGTTASVTKSFVTPDVARQLKSAHPGDLVVTTTSENEADVCKPVVWLGKGDIAIGGHSCVFRHSLDPIFVAYCFQTAAFHEQKRKVVWGTKVKDIKVSDLARISIPVPPRPVQTAIVAALQTMERLGEVLQEEVDCRRRQFAYYAHALLTLGDDVPRRRLGGLATIVRGASPRPIQSFFCPADQGVPWIKIGDVPAAGKYITKTAQHVTPAGAAKSRRVRPGDFVLSNSMSFGRPYISKIDGYIHDGWLAISDFGASFNPDYLYYLLRSAPIQEEFARRAGSGTVKNLNADIVKSIEVPVPPMQEQGRVVELLNAFDLLVNDSASGLPAEVAGRRRQFEYYREQLLALSMRPHDGAAA